jgi:hypothetical protein
MSTIALILAAGRGARLRPHTDHRPKCLVELAGQSLLARQWQSLRAAGVNDIRVITGYRAADIEALGYPTVHNPSFATTNMVSTLFCAREHMKGTADLLIVYGDVVFEPRIVRALLVEDVPLSTDTTGHTGDVTGGTGHDLHVFERFRSQPNFVTSKRVVAPLVELAGTSEVESEPSEVGGRLVLVPRADPGYDWLFGHPLAGLITMYGGANSHLAIRAAEANLPAAIGVGEACYERLARARVLEMDCAGQQIRSIR